MEQNGTEWNGKEWNYMKENGIEQNGMEGNGRELNGTEWIRIEQNGTEWNRMEQNGMKRKWNGTIEKGSLIVNTTSEFYNPCKSVWNKQMIYTNYKF